MSTQSTTGRTLYLTLIRKWFVEILHGRKTEEYREIKPIWERRLFGDYSTVTFRNGYTKTSPLMVLQYKGCEEKWITHPMNGERTKVYAVKLGRLLHVQDCAHLIEDGTNLFNQPNDK